VFFCTFFFPCLPPNCCSPLYKTFLGRHLSARLESVVQCAFSFLSAQWPVKLGQEPGLLSASSSLPKRVGGFSLDVVFGAMQRFSEACFLFFLWIPFLLFFSFKTKFPLNILFLQDSGYCPVVISASSLGSVLVVMITLFGTLPTVLVMSALPSLFPLNPPLEGIFTAPFCPSR